jgi:hypothetical protein
MKYREMRNQENIRVRLGPDYVELSIKDERKCLTKRFSYEQLKQISDRQILLNSLLEEWNK